MIYYKNDDYYLPVKRWIKMTNDAWNTILEILDK